MTNPESSLGESIFKKADGFLIDSLFRSSADSPQVDREQSGLGRNFRSQGHAIRNQVPETGQKPEGEEAPGRFKISAVKVGELSGQTANGFAGKPDRYRRSDLIPFCDLT